MQETQVVTRTKAIKTATRAPAPLRSSALAAKYPKMLTSAAITETAPWATGTSMAIRPPMGPTLTLPFSALIIWAAYGIKTPRSGTSSLV